jgi:hypothetical protein
MKTNRVVKGEELIIGQASVPSNKTREGNLYPWTKPMKGWKRVLVGYGQWKQPGRTRQKNRSSSPIKATRKKFTPYKRTYLWKEKQ